MQYLRTRQERGVSLIITFIIVTIMLAIVLGVSTLLFSEIKVLGNMGNSVSAFYAAYSGVEKTLYYDRKQFGGGIPRGLCQMCTFCGEECQNCNATALGPAGCNPSQCDNCMVKYTTEFDDRSYSVTATVTPDPDAPGNFILSIRSQGYYRGTTRAVELTSN